MSLSFQFFSRVTPAPLRFKPFLLCDSFEVKTGVPQLCCEVELGLVFGCRTGDLAAKVSLQVVVRKDVRLLDLSKDAHPCLFVLFSLFLLLNLSRLNHSHLHLHLLVNSVELIHACLARLAYLLKRFHLLAVSEVPIIFLCVTSRRLCFQADLLVLRRR